MADSYTLKNLMLAYKNPVQVPNAPGEIQAMAHTADNGQAKRAGWLRLGNAYYMLGQDLESIISDPDYQLFAESLEKVKFEAFRKSYKYQWAIDTLDRANRDDDDLSVVPACARRIPQIPRPSGGSTPAGGATGGGFNASTNNHGSAPAAGVTGGGFNASTNNHGSAPAAGVTGGGFVGSTNHATGGGFAPTTTNNGTHNEAYY